MRVEDIANFKSSKVDFALLKNHNESEVISKVETLCIVCLLWKVSKKNLYKTTFKI